MTHLPLTPILAGLLFTASAVLIITWIRYLSQKSRLTALLNSETAHNAKLTSEIATLGANFANQQLHFHQEINALTARIATLETENQHLAARLAEAKGDREELLRQFEHLSGNVLRDQGTRVANQNKETLQQLLEPVSNRLGEFSRLVADTYEKGLRDQLDLRAELKRLHDANRQITTETTSLVNALKNDNAVQGSWGEMVLQRILERSGLTEGDTFITQKQVSDDEGQRRRPDVVILLPDNKHLVIDAKVSLSAWEKYINGTDDAERRVSLQSHTDSVRRHITTLGQRDYPSLPDYESPDFVILFMPVEAAFGAALQADPSLFQLAWDKKVVLTGPATLLATLRTVASVWRIEHQNRNVLEIARQGGLLHDRLISFASDMEKIGGQIDRLQALWQKASDKLTTGKGNLIARASRLKQLGANTRSQPDNNPTLEENEEPTDEN